MYASVASQVTEPTIIPLSLPQSVLEIIKSYAKRKKNNKLYLTKIEPTAPQPRYWASIGAHFFAYPHHKTICIADLHTRRCLRTLEVQVPITCLINLPQERLASGAQDGTINIWDPNEGMCLATLPSYDPLQKIRTLVYIGPDRIAAAIDRTVCVWDLEKTQRFEKYFVAHPFPITTMARMPSDHLAVGANQSIRIWDISTKTCYKIFPTTVCASAPRMRTITCLAYDGGNKRFIAGFLNNTLAIFDPNKPYPLILEGHTQPPYKITVTPHGYSSRSDAEVCEWGNKLQLLCSLP